MNKKWHKILVFSLVALLSGSWGQSVFANQDDYATSRQGLITRLPHDVHPCVPKSVQGGKLWSNLERGGESYYYLTFFLPNGATTIIKSNGINCQQIIPLKDGGNYPLSNYLSPELTYQLVLEKYRRLIEEAGGKEAFQKILIAEEDPGSVIFVFPEDVWAYQQLGLQFPRPDSVVVVGSEGIPSFNQQ